MGPRRGMDGFARPQRPAGAPPRPPQPQPVGRPAPQPQPQPQPRPAQRPQPRPVPPPGYRPDPYGRQAVTRQQEAATRQAPAEKPAKPRRERRRRSGNGWRVVLQFVVGLLVIAGVAAAIVALYVKYYQ